MAFDVAGSAYQRFMGRFSEKLSVPFADFAGVDSGSGMRVLDVGCGPGALTAVLVERLGAAAVTGADPSEPFVAAVRDGCRRSTSGWRPRSRCRSRTTSSTRPSRSWSCTS